MSPPGITSLYAIRQFEEELKEFVEQENSICRFEEWMLQEKTRIVK